MADQDTELILEQKTQAIFGDGAVALNAFLTGVNTFGNNFSQVADKLIQFFQITKTFLVMMKNPLTGPLIRTIDSLIVALEDLQNIGMGSVTVWPWEHGQYPPRVNTEKLDQAIIGLAAAARGLDPKTMAIGADGDFIKTKNGTALLTPDQDLGDVSNTDMTKDDIYNTLLSIRNFFHPDTWQGGDVENSGDGSLMDDARDTLLKTIDFTQKELIVKELPPTEFVDKIVRSLESSSPDNNRPSGSGHYQAHIIMFALPTINSVIQVVQSFADYFGDVLSDELLKRLASPDNGKNDEETKTIEMGEPLTKPVDSTRQLVSGKPYAEWFSETGDFKPYTGEKKLPDGTYKDSDDTTNSTVGATHKIPMFKKGDRIVQEGGVMGLSNFTATVVEHKPIVIKNGMVISNRVIVKGVRGEIIKTNLKSYNSATLPIFRCAIREDGELNQLSYPMFRPDTQEKPQASRNLSFFGTMKADSNVITDIIPNDREGQRIRIGMKNQWETQGTPKINVYKARMVKELDSADSQRVVASYMRFVRSLKKGMIIDHQFLKPYDLSEQAHNLYKDEVFADSKFQFNYGKLLDVVPSLGVNYSVASIKIDGVEISTTDLKETDLFNYDDEMDVGGVVDTPYEMRELTISIGFQNYDGSFEEDPWLVPNISPPDGLLLSWDTKIPTDGGEPGPPNRPFELFTTNKNDTPNWKYVRVSDLFPIYGSTIQEAIGQVKKFKKQVQGIVKDIDEYIKFLENQIKNIKKLNDQIQNLIAFFSQGLNSAGIYSKSFNGKGVKNFKTKLQNMKLKAAKNTVSEISLETIEKEVVIDDPFTGLPKKVKRKILRPTVQKVEDPDAPTEPVPISELSNLKYCGGLVFFAQGADSEKYKKFVSNFNALETLGAGFLANLFNVGDTIAEKIQPEVYDIQQNSDGEWKNIDDAQIEQDGTIRIVFTNDAHTLSEEEIKIVEEQAERSVDFSPRIQTQSVLLTNNENYVETIDDSIVLFQGTYERNQDSGRMEWGADNVYYQFDIQFGTSASGGGEGVQQFFNIDLRPKLPLARSTSKYKVLVRSTILNEESQSLRREKVTSIGFDVQPVRVLSGSLV